MKRIWIRSQNPLETTLSLQPKTLAAQNLELSACYTDWPPELQWFPDLISNAQPCWPSPHPQTHSPSECWLQECCWPPYQTTDSAVFLVFVFNLCFFWLPVRFVFHFIICMNWLCWALFPFVLGDVMSGVGTFIYTLWFQIWWLCGLSWYSCLIWTSFP